MEHDASLFLLDTVANEEALPLFINLFINSFTRRALIFWTEVVVDEVFNSFCLLLLALFAEGLSLFFVGAEVEQLSEHAGIEKTICEDCTNDISDRVQEVEQTTDLSEHLSHGVECGLELIVFDVSYELDMSDL